MLATASICGNPLEAAISPGDRSTVILENKQKKRPDDKMTARVATHLQQRKDDAEAGKPTDPCHRPLLEKHLERNERTDTPPSDAPANLSPHRRLAPVPPLSPMRAEAGQVPRPPTSPSNCSLFVRALSTWSSHPSTLEPAVRKACLALA